MKSHDARADSDAVELGTPVATSQELTKAAFKALISSQWYCGHCNRKTQHCTCPVMFIGETGVHEVSP